MTQGGSGGALAFTEPLVEVWVNENTAPVLLLTLHAASNSTGKLKSVPTPTPALVWLCICVSVSILCFFSCNINQKKRKFHSKISVFTSFVFLWSTAGVVYSIKGGNEGGLFHADPHSGRVMLTTPLDYETRNMVSDFVGVDRRD